MNMNEILNRYFEGETSLEEERSLKAYFASGDVAENHKIYADLFSCFKTESAIEYNGAESVNLLLEKYFEGESSLDEEKSLKAYFASGNVEEAHLVYAELFSCYKEESTITYKVEDSINLLLEKYFEGASSLSEEERLKSYFQSGDISEEHKQFAPLFDFYADAKKEVLEKDIDIKQAKTLHIVRRTMMGIAAGLAILLGSLFVMNSYNDVSNDVLAETELSPEELEALETTKEALAFLGVQFNKGTESLEQIKNVKKVDIFKN